MLASLFQQKGKLSEGETVQYDMFNECRLTWKVQRGSGLLALGGRSRLRARPAVHAPLVREWTSTSAPPCPQGTDPSRPSSWLLWKRWWSFEICPGKLKSVSVLNWETKREKLQDLWWCLMRIRSYFHDMKENDTEYNCCGEFDFVKQILNYYLFLVCFTKSSVTYLVISSFDIFNFDKRIVQFWARRLSMTEMILCLRPIVPISLKSSIDPSTDWKIQEISFIFEIHECKIII